MGCHYQSMLIKSVEKLELEIKIAEEEKKIREEKEAEEKRLKEIEL